MIFKTKDGEVTLECDEFSSKIATDRKFYMKYPGDKTFKYTEVEVPKGMTKKNKERWLFEHRQRLLERIEETK